MSVNSIVMLFYAVYTVYILLICGVTSISITDILPAVILMWITFGVFTYGGKLATKIKIKKIMRSHINLELSERVWIFISLLSGPFAIIAARYYTGQWPTEVISNLLNGVSNYAHYQYYFAENTIATAGIVKLPYILMLFWVKFVLLYGCVRIFLYQKRISFKSIIMLGVCVVPHLYVALARGTNFEYYEFMVLMVYIILSKIKSKISIQKMGISAVKALGVCLVLGLTLVAIYCVVLNARGYILNVRISKDISYDENSLLVQLLPGFSFIIVNLFSYLGFGLFYIASFINEVWMANLPNFFAGFSFKGFELLYQSSTKDIMRETIDMGVRWHPDLINCINDWGFIGTFILIGALGYITQKLHMGEKSLWKGMAMYLVVLQMLSLPIGNFIVCSSANKLLVVMLAVFLCFERKKQE